MRSPSAGWTVRSGEGLRALLLELGATPAKGDESHAEAAVTGEAAMTVDAGVTGAPGVRLLVMHERGETLSGSLLHATRPVVTSSVERSVRTVLVLGDHLGFTEEEESVVDELGGAKASVSPLPLLASHCIVLAHAALDSASVAASAAAGSEGSAEGM